MAQRPELATDTFLKELREEVDLSRGAEVLADLLGSTDSLATIWARCPRADWLLAILDRALAAGLVRRGDLAGPLRRAVHTYILHVPERVVAAAAAALRRGSQRRREG